MTQKQMQKYQIKQDDSERKEMDKKWNQINERIKSKNPEYEQPVLPFDS